MIFTQLKPFYQQILLKNQSCVCIENGFNVERKDQEKSFIEWDII